MYIVHHYRRSLWAEDERMSKGELFKKYAGLLPEFGRVVCVSAGFITKNERKIQSFIKGGEEEWEIKDKDGMSSDISWTVLFICL